MNLGFRKLVWSEQRRDPAGVMEDEEPSEDAK